MTGEMSPALPPVLSRIPVYRTPLCCRLPDGAEAQPRTPPPFQSPTAGRDGGALPTSPARHQLHSQLPSTGTGLWGPWRSSFSPVQTRVPASRPGTDHRGYRSSPRRGRGVPGTSPNHHSQPKGSRGARVPVRLAILGVPRDPVPNGRRRNSPAGPSRAGRRWRFCRRSRRRGGGRSSSRPPSAPWRRGPGTRGSGCWRGTAPAWPARRATAPWRRRRAATGRAPATTAPPRRRD